MLKCCKTTKQVSDLQQNMLANIIVLNNGKEQTLVATKEILENLIEIGDEESMLDGSLDLEDLNITYDNRSKFITEIKSKLEANESNLMLDDAAKYQKKDSTEIKCIYFAQQCTTVHIFCRFMLTTRF